MTARTPGRGRVLIGEDVRVIAYRMSEALQKAGYQVDSANDGEDCLRKARADLPDLVVLDIMMPKLHGVEVLRALRAAKETAAIGVIICTARDFKPDYEECQVLGVAGFLLKPFESGELINAVDAFFERNGAAESVSGGPVSSEKAPSFAPTLDTSGGSVQLWGTRGSTPTPGARFLRHGGNTSCMALEVGDELFIFDAGSGLRDLGQEVMAGSVRKLNIFVTHTHWDHIQGFPFFLPAYVPGFDITIWGAEGFGKDLESIFRGQLDRDYFPVQMEDMQSTLHFRHLTDSPIRVNGCEISWEYAQHPGATVGYKINVQGKKVAWVPDNEFLQGYVGPPEELTREHPQVTPYRKMIEFVSDVDVLIHEAQYTNAEYPSKIGWGHCGVSNACALMKLANVPLWIVTHHDPTHDDAFLERKLNMTRQMLTRIGHDMEVQHGYDGMTRIL